MVYYICSCSLKYYLYTLSILEKNQRGMGRRATAEAGKRREEKERNTRKRGDLAIWANVAEYIYPLKNQ